MQFREAAFMICIFLFTNIATILDSLKQQHPDGIRNYETTYKHDFFGKLGENKATSFQYSNHRSLTPDSMYKPVSRSSTPNNMQ